MLPKEIQEINSPSTPEEGTRTPARKFDPENNRRSPKSEAVRNATIDAGAAKRAERVQAGKDNDFTTQPQSGCCDCD